MYYFLKCRVDPCPSIVSSREAPQGSGFAMNMNIGPCAGQQNILEK